VLVWGGRWDTAALRRLQLAAETGGALAFLFRDSASARHPSPAPLRLQVGAGVAAGVTGYRVKVLKQRGGSAGALLRLPREVQDSPWEQPPAAKGCRTSAAAFAAA
jgi:hypothetical protein